MQGIGRSLGAVHASKEARAPGAAASSTPIAERPPIADASTAPADAVAPSAGSPSEPAPSATAPASSPSSSPAPPRLGALRTGDRGVALAPHLDALSASPVFGHLDPGVQQVALDALAYVDRAEPQGVRDATRYILAERGLQTEANGCDHVTRLATLEGFGSLSPAEQKKLLLSACGGGTPHVLLTMLTEKKLPSMPPEAQVSALQQLARDLPLPTRLEEPSRISIEGKPIYDYGETPYAVPTPDGRQASCPGHAYGVTVGDKVVPVMVPASDPPATGTRFPTLLEVVRALRALPDELREGVEAVTVCPVRKASKAGLDGGALADSGAGGVPGMIRFFASADWDQGVVDATMVHESGHVRTNVLWGREGRTFSDASPSAGWASWRQAMEADAISPSGYARVAPTEDFSEALRATFQFRGTPLEPHLRSLMPHRTALIDQLVPSWAS